jgi:hypothetical protein
LKIGKCVVPSASIVSLVLFFCTADIHSIQCSSPISSSQFPLLPNVVIFTY